MGLHIAEVINGSPKTIQAPDSEVILHVPSEVHGVILGNIHTDHWRFSHLVEEMGCFVSPRPEFHFVKKHGSKPVSGGFFKLQLPVWSNLPPTALDKIQVWNRKNRAHKFQPVPKISSEDSSPTEPVCFAVEAKTSQKHNQANNQNQSPTVNVYTTDFCDHLVSVQGVKCCSQDVCMMVFSKLRKRKTKTIADVSLRFGGPQYDQKDYLSVSRKVTGPRGH